MLSKENLAKLKKVAREEKLDPVHSEKVYLCLERRHSCTPKSISGETGIDEIIVEKILFILCSPNEIWRDEFQGEVYYHPLLQNELA